MHLHLVKYHLIQLLLLCMKVTIMFYQKYVDLLEKISLYSKKKVIAAAAVTENGPLNYEKTNSFRNTKFGIQIAFSMNMCKMSSSKIKKQWGPHWGPPKCCIFESSLPIAFKIWYNISLEYKSTLMILS